MAAIDFIYFDLGNVILNFDHDIGCNQVAKLTGLSPAQVDDAIFGSGLEDKFETGLVDEDQFHESFCSATGCDIDKAQLLLATSDIFTPNMPVFSIITQLRTVGFPIGILSNTCSAHWELERQRFLILKEFFDPCILSYESKSMKPDGKIYQDAIERAGFAAGQCFFVDDKPENVAGAVEAGMDAVLYESPLALRSALAQRGVRFNG